MRDLSVLADASFDLVFHPVPNVFIHEVRPVWREACRGLRPGGVLLAGLMGPAIYVLDQTQKGALVATHRLPFDSRDLSDEERLRLTCCPACAEQMRIIAALARGPDADPLAGHQALAYLGRRGRLGGRPVAVQQRELKNGAALPWRLPCRPLARALAAVH
jgi:SAM-dependent methyltransferase